MRAIPWTGATFKRRHNQSLTPAQSNHAARIANAILQRTGSDQLAIATANRWAKTHSKQAGGTVPPGMGAVESGIQRAQNYENMVLGQPQTPVAFPDLSGMAGQPGIPPMPSAPVQPGSPAASQGPHGYLYGNAGSPVDLSALPHYKPQVPADMGINSAGYMNVPQVGPFTLDPMTGALTPTAQQALQALAQRGLTIGGGGGGGGAAAGPAGQGGANTVAAQNFGGEGGAGAGNGQGGPSGGVGGSVGLGGSSSSLNDVNLSIGPSLGDIASGAKTGLGIAGLSGNPVIAAIGAIAGAGHAALTGGHTVPDMGAGNIDVNATGGQSGLGGVGGDLSGVGGDPAGAMEAAGAAADITGGGPGSARGGRQLAAGGAPQMMSPSQATPWFARREASASTSPSGLVHSPIGGRSDHIPMSLAAGSYVVPADIVSGMGQGNSLSGAQRFDQMIHSGPFGTRLPMPKLGGTLPRAPGMPHMVHASHFSRGGRTKGRIPVIVAGGERIVSPEEVARLSGGDLKKGHDMLDRFVVEARKHIVQHTKALPGPEK